MLPFARVTIVGLGLIGSSIARAVRVHMPTVRLTGYDANPEVRATAGRIGLCDDITDTAGASVIDADLVVLCVPVGAMGAAAAEIAADLPADATVSAAIRPAGPAPIMATSGALTTSNCFIPSTAA